MRSGEALFAAMATLAIRNKRRYGGFIVHLGIILIAIGVTGSQAFPLQTEIQLKRGGDP
jgi:cytochrome c-type biogenesis protein CcmF